MNFVTRLRDLTATGRSVACVAMLVGIALQSSTVFAFQDNPFATEDAAPTATPAADQPTAATDDSDAGVFQITLDNSRSGIGLVVRSVRIADPKTADELLDAVEKLLDVDAIGDARFYLDKLIKQNLPQQQLFELFQVRGTEFFYQLHATCLLYTSPSPRDQRGSRMPSSA